MNGEVPINCNSMMQSMAVFIGVEQQVACSVSNHYNNVISLMNDAYALINRNLINK